MLSWLNNARSAARRSSSDTVADISICSFGRPSEYSQTRSSVLGCSRRFTKASRSRCCRTDNGVPFASAHALYGLSKLSVWWLRLGIGLERIKPGHPEQNGRHERMYLTLKQQATKPPATNMLQQQARFDRW